MIPLLLIFRSYTGRWPTDKEMAEIFGRWDYGNVLTKVFSSDNADDLAAEEER